MASYPAARAAQAVVATTTFSEFLPSLIWSQASTQLTFTEQEAVTPPNALLGDRPNEAKKTEAIQGVPINWREARESILCTHTRKIPKYSLSVFRWNVS